MQPCLFERKLLASSLPTSTRPCFAGQAQVGVYNKAALQRFDLVLSEAAKNGIKVIFPLVNGDNFLGGPQWYFDQARRACIRQAHLLLRD